MPRDADESEDRLADLLVDFETQLAAGGRPGALTKEQSTASDEDQQRLSDAKQCVLLLEEVWPHARALDASLPEAIGRFRIVGELGRGGFSIVYLAYDERLSREVALKVQRPEAIISATLRERFLREAKTAARLTHPRIASVHEVGQTGLQIWIASEYVAGESLAAWLRSRVSPVEPRTAARFMMSLCEAVEFAHRGGVLHRDLKPGNVLLEPAAGKDSRSANLADYQPKLIDFGLARLDESEHHATRTGALIGTPPYMAPEQATGNVARIGPATDVHALGTILYELLTGRAAFAGENDVQTLRKVMEDEPTRPRKICPAVPADLEAICLKCLAKQPRDRFASAQALAADLDRFLTGHPTVARPATALARLLKWIRRHPAVAALVAVVVAAALTIVVLTAVSIARLRASNLAAEFSAENARRSEHVAEQYLYASRMHMGYQAIEDGDLEQVNELLGYYQAGSKHADLRTFEWFHLRRRLHSERLTLTGHEGEVYAVAYTPDGWHVISGGQDGTIRIWDAQSGGELKNIAAHGSCVNELVYSPDQTVLASGSCDGKIKFWRADTWEWIDTFEGHGHEVLCLAFCSANSKLLACGGREPIVRIWDLETREVVQTLDVGGDVNALAWNSEGSTLLISGGPPNSGNVAAWTLEPRQVKTYPWETMSVAASRRNDFCWGGLDGKLYLLSEPNQHPSVLTAHAGHIEALVFSPNGDTLFSAGSDRAIRAWNIDSLAAKRVFPGHTGRVEGLAASPRGSDFASASFDGTVKLWNDFPSDQTVCRARCRMLTSRSAAISDDLCYLAVPEELDKLRVYAIDSGASLGELPLAAYFMQLQFVPGKPILFGAKLRSEGSIDEWDVASWKRGKSYVLPEETHGAMRWGNHLVLERRQSTEFLEIEAGDRELELPRPRFLSNPTVLPSQPMLSPDGAALLLMRWKSHEPDWLLTKGSQPRSFEASWTIAIDNTGMRVARFVGNHSVGIVDLGSDQPSVTLRHSEGVTAAAFSPDGKTLASCAWTNVVYLWNVDTGQEIARLSTSADQVRNVRFSRDGRRLAAIGHSNVKSKLAPPASLPGVPEKTPIEESTVIVTVWSSVEGD